VNGLKSVPVVVHFANVSISFTANGVPYNLAAPDSTITFSPTATSATTTYNAGTDTWETTVPSNVGGNVFLDGLAFHVPVAFPGGINPVVWSGDFSSSAAGIEIVWQWAAAVYPSLPSDYNALGVKAVDDTQACSFKNSDHAGTPENFKNTVIAGGRGGGGSDFTGSYSGSDKAMCDDFTRTCGFYANHKSVTQNIITATGSFTICGRMINDTAIDDGESAIETLCVEPHGDQRLQLSRQLLACALNMAAGSSRFDDFDACNATCTDPDAAPGDLSDCITLADTFNQRGDSQTASFDPPGPADSLSCQLAHATACTFLNPAACAVP
jgi:hypothetical protein